MGINKNLYHHLKKLPVRLVLLFILFILSVYFFGYIVHEVLWEKEINVDERILNFLTHYVSPGVTRFMDLVSYLGSDYILFLEYAILIIWLLIKKKKSIALNVALVGISSSLLLFFLKDVFHRGRPLHPLNEPAYNYSFPSGHTSLSFIFYGLLIYLAWTNTLSKRHKYILSIFLLLLSLLIGFSRIYLRKHYPSDVIAGFCVGFAWLVLSIWFLQKVKNNSSFHKKLKIVK
jgi:membrane-associated phospholipid phosphatase